MSRRAAPPRPYTALLLVLLSAASLPEPARGQSAPPVTVLFPDGREASLPVETGGGYPVIPAASLEELGWREEEGDGGRTVLLRHRTGLELELRPGSPFVAWDGLVVQMVDAPYSSGEAFYVPLQLIVDLFPGFLPEAYAFEEERALLLAEGAELPPPEEMPDPGPGAPDGVADPDALPPEEFPADAELAAADQAEAEEDGEASAERPLVPWSTADGGAAPAVFIIDPGHGGDDTGVVGATGVEEKEVALAAGLALARVLARRPGTEVWLTRERDVAISSRSRSEWANEWRSDRPGAFISIHANALPDRVGVRGFETYFLADAETEQEQRVVEAEGASPGDTFPYDPTVLEYREASSALAGEVQWELGEFHPGPDRGVRRGPLPSLLGVRMAAVAVEVGFLTNPEEERLLVEDDFHRDVAEAIRRAIDRFLEAYPTFGVP